ncbi:hypothetical protein FA95DRAFT_1303624 [Auriscalpium vulgare]|uniref:Uncharacterized protein n=1 Tax=Auriscalpium vulgare TaxID=40419 RepID=A0ACB8RST2_9AGAM|nr:hypothetical protein FA95DRAFT_1303624 [Auriscalpium vulgare]
MQTMPSASSSCPYRAARLDASPIARLRRPTRPHQAHMLCLRSTCRFDRNLTTCTARSSSSRRPYVPAAGNLTARIRRGSRRRQPKLPAPCIYVGFVSPLYRCHLRARHLVIPHAHAHAQHSDSRSIRRPTRAHDPRPRRFHVLAVHLLMHPPSRVGVAARQWCHLLQEVSFGNRRPGCPSSLDVSCHHLEAAGAHLRAEW